MPSLPKNLSAIRQSVWNKYGRNVVVGWIGDSRHRNRVSDHNPASDGQVHAVDVMLDGARGAAVAKAAIGRSDVAYVIFHNTIWSAKYGWKARRYHGKYHGHVHISGKYDTASENRAVGLNFGGTKPTPSKPYQYPTSKPPYPGLLRKGSKGNAVRTLQRRLNVRGYEPKLLEDGNFGEATERNVEAFQRFAKVDVDGLVGEQTHNKLWDMKIT